MSHQISLIPGLFLHKVQLIIRFLWTLIEIMSLKDSACGLLYSLHSIHNSIKEEEEVLGAVSTGFRQT